MRPQKLIMSAFGPYADKTVVELDRLGNSGIYLITGDTGAGKTTIFDAITYALFGEASGNTRETSMFRSKYALPETTTEVELYFTCKNKEYYIKRNPEYERPKTRGDGFTTEKANAELHLPDGRVITKLKEVTSEVEEIIGVDRNQFTQIAMIAQGDFLKLLIAPTDERKKIFQKLFKTQSYYVLQERIKSESGKLSHEYTAIKSSIEQYINGIVCDEENPMFSKFSDAKNGELTTEETAELLKKLISDDELSEKVADEEKQKRQKDLDAVKIRITKAEDARSAKADLTGNELSLNAEIEKENSLREKFEQEKEKLPKVKEITKKAAQINALLPDYDELLEMRKTFSANKSFIDASGEKITKTKAFIKACEEEINSLTEECKTLEKTGEEKISLENEKTRKQEDKEKLKKLSDAICDVLKSVSEFSDANRTYSEKYQSAETLDAELKEKTRIYLEAQAGILADTLELNKPCPVCGSTLHPKIASKPEDVPSKEEIDSLGDKLTKANNAANEARDEAGKLKGQLKEKEESVKKDITSLLGDYSYEDAKNVINIRISEIDALINELNKKLTEAQSKIDRKTEIDELLPKEKTALDDLKEKLNSIENELKLKTSDNASLLSRAEELKTKLVFPAKTDAEMEISSLNKEAETIQSAYDKALKDLNDSREKLSSLKSAREEIIKRIGKDTDIDLQKEKEKKNALEEKISSLDKFSKTLHSRITSNRISLENILEKLSEIKATEEKWIWMKNLSDTANGNLSGKEKVMLETYIQMTYFDRIINRANTRLMVMSDGQYELKRRAVAENNRSQSGLELDVIDHYNGSRRSVKTLSGGESFKASLSLALGLSDEIQSSAGGIRLDTMFVDEGFGSLDDESLSQAIKALSSLSEGNRLVGIISHVNELKQKIDKQIVVKKDKTGGSSITILS